MTTMASSIDMAFQAVFIALVIVAALIDLRTMRIPNKLVIALLALWAVRTAVMTWILPALNHAASGSLSSERLLLGSILFGGGVAGGLVLGGGTLLTALAFEKITRRPSFGGGDIKLLFAVGLWLGIGRGLACLLIACATSLVLAA
ncbi:MAG: prepilin peptidase, partial [Eggerthellaceae bacterium]|nr:prepilin peptidase [Eggerthellaceae bacterium]